MVARERRMLLDRVDELLADLCGARGMTVREALRENSDVRRLCYQLWPPDEAAMEALWLRNLREMLRRRHTVGPEGAGRVPLSRRVS